jgi:hypothetical protein
MIIRASSRNSTSKFACRLILAGDLLGLLFDPEEARSSETSVNFYWTTRLHIAEDNNLKIVNALLTKYPTKFVTQCSMTGGHQRFVGTCCLHLKIDTENEGYMIFRNVRIHL